MRIVTRKHIVYYQDTNGKEPFILWFESIKDKKIQAKITARLDRVENGNLGDYKSLGDGIFELKFNFSSGYRIYYGQKNEKLIIFLSAGNKSSQEQDIKKAKEYWKTYNKGGAK